MSQKTTSRSTTIPRKAVKSPWLEIMISALWGLVAIILLLFLFSLLFASRDISITLIAPFTTVILVLGGIVAGLRCGGTMRQNGLINGSLTGCVIFLLLLLISFILPGRTLGLLALYKLILLSVSTAVGCILAVNHRKKLKTGKLTKH